MTDTVDRPARYGEQWWGGDLLAGGIEPHDPALYMLGKWVVTDMETGRETEIREGI